MSPAAAPFQLACGTPPVFESTYLSPDTSVGGTKVLFSIISNTASFHESPAMPASTYAFVAASLSDTGVPKLVNLYPPILTFAVMVPNVVSVPWLWRLVMASDKFTESANLVVTIAAPAATSLLVMAKFNLDWSIVAAALTSLLEIPQALTASLFVTIPIVELS